MADKVKIDVGLNHTGFVSGADKIKESVSDLRMELLNGLKGAMFAAFSVEALKKFNDEFKETVNELENARKRTGAGTNDLQVWKKQAEAMGGSLEEVTHILNKMTAARDKALEEPNGKEAKAFEKLGINRSTLVNNEGPALFKLLQDQISKTGSAVGSLGNLIDLLGEKSVKSMGMFTQGFSDTEAKMKSMGKVIDAEIISKAREMEKIGKQGNFMDSLLGGANNKAKVFGAFGEFWAHTMQAVKLPAIALAAVTDSVGITSGAKQRRFNEIQQTQVDFMMAGSESSFAGASGGMTQAQSDEIKGKLLAKGQEREEQLKRIAALREKNSAKELTNEEKLTKLKKEQLAASVELAAAQSKKDKSDYLSKLETYLGKEPAIKELQDKVDKEKKEKKDKDDKLVGEYMKKTKDRLFDSYQPTGDSLTGGGNFLGESRQRFAELNLQTEQRDILKLIEVNTREMIRQNPNLNSVDDFPIF